MRRIGLVVAGTMLLAGCAPNTDQAWENCVEVSAYAWQVEHEIAESDTNGMIDSYAAAGEFCDAQKTADPNAFVERWG